MEFHSPNLNRVEKYKKKSSPNIVDWWLVVTIHSTTTTIDSQTDRLCTYILVLIRDWLTDWLLKSLYIILYCKISTLIVVFVSSVVHHLRQIKFEYKTRDKGRPNEIEIKDFLLDFTLLYFTYLTHIDLDRRMRAREIGFKN